MRFTVSERYDYTQREGLNFGNGDNDRGSGFSYLSPALRLEFHKSYLASLRIGHFSIRSQAMNR